MKILHKMIWILIVLVLSACQPISQNNQQAAHDALEDARIQMDSGNRVEAL